MPKYDLNFSPPLMNAAGMLGFSPDARLLRSLELGTFGAFITNPLSLQPRTPAHGERFLPYPGGFLLHTGHANPGLKAVIRRYAAHWSQSDLPVIVHLIPQDAAELSVMLSMLEPLAGRSVMGVEIGLPPEIESLGLQNLLAAAQGELPVLVRLPLERVLALGAEAVAAGAQMISLGPPRGILAQADGHWVRGRLYGPALFPQVLEIVRLLAAQGLPTVGGGGVYRPEDTEAMLALGAQAVQIDTWLWR